MKKAAIFCQFVSFLSILMMGVQSYGRNPITDSRALKKNNPIASTQAGVALKKGTLRYWIRQDKGAKPPSFIGYDFEVAMNVWLNKLGLQKIQLVQVSEPQIATRNGESFFKGVDLIIDIRKELEQPVAAHFSESQEYSMEGPYMIPSIQINANGLDMRFLSLADAIRRDAKAKLQELGGRFKVRHLKRVMSLSIRPAEMAEQFIERGFVSRWGQRFRIDGRSYLSSYMVFLQQIGHLFGLKDLEKSHGHPTIMKGNDSRKFSFVPTEIDVARAKYAIVRSRGGNDFGALNDVHTSVNCQRMESL